MEICGEEGSPATRGVHLVDYVTTSHVTLESPVVHEPLVQRAAHAEIIGGQRSYFTAQHALRARHLPDLPHGMDLRALAAATVVEKSAIPHEHRKIVAPAVVDSIGASALPVDSEDVHQPAAERFSLSKREVVSPCFARHALIRSSTAGLGATSASPVLVEGVAVQKGSCPTDSLRERRSFRFWTQSTSSAL
jgi:hypothetical protein